MNGLVSGDKQSGWVGEVLREVGKRGEETRLKDLVEILEAGRGEGGEKGRVLGGVLDFFVGYLK